MKAIRSSFRCCAIIGGLIASLVFIRAQTVNKSLSIGKISLDDPNVNWNAFSDFEVELMAVEATTPLPAEAVARASGYYSAQYPNWPPLPANLNGLPLWSLGDGIYLLDDRQFDYAAVSSVNAQRMSTMAMEPLLPGDGGDGGTYQLMSGASGFAVDYSTNLWIANFALSSNNAVGILSNSVADISYEIQYKHNLATDTQWLSAGFVLGSEVTNWTALVLANVNLTNNAFFRIRSWEDDGSGLPLWWQMQYFGYVGADAYGNPAGDGWNNLQKFQNGMNPNVFYTPPAPQGLTVSYNDNNRTATLNWLPSPGPITGYTIQRQDWSGVTTNLTLPPNATGFSFVEPANLSLHYNLQANYNGGNSAWSSVGLYDVAFPSVSLITGPGGYLYAMVDSAPKDLSHSNIFRTAPGIGRMGVAATTPPI
jgi:hypothetical protein